MIQAKCVQKLRTSNNKIYGYRLVDINGKTQDVRPEYLKDAIKQGKITVVNLTLTSDGRLVDKKAEKQLTTGNLGPAPVKSETKKEKLEDTLLNMLDKPQKEFIKIVGNGDAFCGSDFIDDGDELEVITQILGVHYIKSEMYGCTLGINCNKQDMKAYIMFQGKDAMGKEIISDSIKLSKPINSKDNHEKIEKMFIQFAHKVNNWIDSNK